MRCPRSIRGHWPDVISMQEQIWSSEAIRMCCRASSIIKGKPIFYSLGNFVFGSSIPKTMLVQAAFTGDSLSLQLIPGTSSGGYTSMLTDAESKTQFYQYLEGISFGVSVGEDGIVSPQP